MDNIKKDLLLNLNEIEHKLGQNIPLSKDELETLLISALWSEESNECK